MDNSDEKIFLSEVVYSIKARDLIKVRVLLRESSNVSFEATEKLIDGILNCEGNFPIPLLIYILIYQADVSSKFPRLNMELYRKVS